MINIIIILEDNIKTMEAGINYYKLMLEQNSDSILKLILCGDNTYYMVNYIIHNTNISHDNIITSYNTSLKSNNNFISNDKIYNSILFIRIILAKLYKYYQLNTHISICISKKYLHRVSVIAPLMLNCLTLKFISTYDDIITEQDLIDETNLIRQFCHQNNITIKEKAPLDTCTPP